MKEPVDSYLLRSHFLVPTWLASLTMSSHDGRCKGALWLLSIRIPSHFPEAPLSIPLGLKFQHMNFGGVYKHLIYNRVKVYVQHF